MHLEVRQVSMAYNGPLVVQEVDLVLIPGDIGCLLGPSGCGKTTLLRAIAGFEPLLSGEIVIQGRTVSRPGLRLPPEERRVGMVFQDLALFPHLSIADNIAFVLRRRSPEQRRERIRELLALVGLEQAAQVFPHQLSGGQQQRVALARAMAPRPDLLLLDEPFSSLDVELREKLAREVRRILKQDGLTALLVTHDQFEAFAMADEIGVMHDGRLLQWDIAYNLYHHPVHRFVADFIGQGVMLPGTLLDDRSVVTELGTVHGNLNYRLAPGAKVDVFIRPDDVCHDETCGTYATVIGKIFRGADNLYSLELPSGSKLLFLTSSHQDSAIGQRLGIRVAAKDLAIFPAC